MSEWCEDCRSLQTRLENAALICADLYIVVRFLARPDLTPDQRIEANDAIEEWYRQFMGADS